MSAHSANPSELYPGEEKHKKLTCEIGNTLLLVQIAEQRINRALLVASAGADPITMEQLEKMEGSKRAQSLGVALHQLRKRVQFPLNLENFLTVFIDKRNLLAHRFADVEKQEDFVNELRQDAFKAIYIFYILLDCLLEQRGLLTDPISGIELKILRFVQKVYPEVVRMLPCELPDELLADGESVFTSKHNVSPEETP